MGHMLTDNRNGLVANARVTIADGYAEREAAKVMLNDAIQATDNQDASITVGADKGYDAQEFIDACLEMDVIPHVAQNTSGRRSAVPDAIVARPGYAISQGGFKTEVQRLLMNRRIGLMGTSQGSGKDL